ncbi:MAG TPA: dihydrolipoamide acetyltransferase family protein [Thermoplasmata archaeon]|nr:dihydrolipoamide acetyltransferase family protein [Thermoplasmata archaeon]
MVYEFRLPDIGEGVAEGEVVQWFVKEGDTVREDGPLVSVLTDKANVEIPSPKAGRILKLHAQVGEKVKVGGLLVTIETGQDNSPPSAAATPPPAKPEEPAPGATPSPPSPPPPGPSGRVLASPNVRRLASERGIDLSQVRGSGPQGRVTEADLAAPTPRSGAPETASTASSGSVQSPPTASEPAPVAGGPGGSAPAGVERIPIRGVRRVIAEHMTEARHRAAHYTYVEEVDASELVRMRERMAKHVEKHGVKLSYLPFVVKGVVAGLRAFPRVNATMDDARQELVVHPEYNIGIATAAPEGLIVPVVKNADRKSISRLAKEIQELAEKGRAGKLQLSEITGGTFTITSLGALGGVLATPILNYPEVAILGVHKIVRRPVYRPDGSIGPADLMNLSVSLDHRVLDGIVGAQFLQVVKSYLEDPHQLFAELA